MKIIMLSTLSRTLLTFRLELLKQMVQTHQVYTLAPNYLDSDYSDLKKLGVEPHTYYLTRESTNVFKEWVTIFSLIKQFKRIKPDLYFGFFLKPNTIGVIVAAICGIKKRYVLIEGLGFYFSIPPRSQRSAFKNKIIKRLLIIFYRLSLPLCEKVFFLNHEDRDELLGYGIKIKKAIVMGGIGVDLNYYHVDSVYKKTTSQFEQYPIVPTFLWMGRLLIEKGLRDFVMAAKYVQEQQPNAQFIILGGVDENPGVLTKEELTTWIATGVIKWIDYQMDVRPFILNATVFVLPSYYREGVPRSIQEAMAMARPIITTDTIGCRETVINGYNGFLVPPHEPMVLADRMMQFIIKPELVLEMGQASRTFAEQHFNVYHFNQKLMTEMALS